MSKCPTCSGNGTEEFCNGCNEPVENCECDYPEGDPPGTFDEDCTECDGTGEVEEDEEN